MGEPGRTPHRRLRRYAALVVAPLLLAAPLQADGARPSPIQMLGGFLPPHQITGSLDTSGLEADLVLPAMLPKTDLTLDASLGLVVNVTRAQRLAEVSTATRYDIPRAALRAYQRAAATTGTSDPTCNLSWGVLAGIGQVESNHGRFGGAVVMADGTTYPRIVGLPLNGVGNVAEIHDTDGGRLDGDKVWDRAVGPMQFIPSTWASMAADGDGDGTSNPNDLDDAALATATYLCAGDTDFSKPASARSAVFRYNHSASYVLLVLTIAAAYDTGLADVVPNGTLTDLAHLSLTAPTVTLHRPVTAERAAVAVAKRVHVRAAEPVLDPVRAGRAQDGRASGSGGRASPAPDPPTAAPAPEPPSGSPVPSDPASPSDPGPADDPTTEPAAPTDPATTPTDGGTSDDPTTEPTESPTEPEPSAGPTDETPPEPTEGTPTTPAEGATSDDDSTVESDESTADGSGESQPEGGTAGDSAGQGEPSGQPVIGTLTLDTDGETWLLDGVPLTLETDELEATLMELQDQVVTATYADGVCIAVAAEQAS